MTDDRFDELLREQAALVAAARERACEAALQDGRFGVLERWLPDGTVEFEVSPLVPYGERHVV